METENNVSSENTVSSETKPSVQNDKNKKCGICSKGYKSSRILPCNHIFCRLCLIKLVEEKELACPLCRKEVNLPNGGVDELPMYFEDDDEHNDGYSGDEGVSEKDACKDDGDEGFGEKDASKDAGDEEIHIASYEDDEDDDDLNPSVDYNASDPENDQIRFCDVCGNNVPAEYECFQCQKVLCGSCKKNHDTWLKHNVQDLKLDLTQAQDKCVKHPEVQVGYFCIDCGSTLCKECVKSGHSLHQTQTLKSYLMEIDEELKNYSSSIELEVENAEFSKEEFYSNTESKVISNIKKVEILGEDFKTEFEKACQIENKKQYKDKTLINRINFIGRKIRKSKRQRKFNHNLISDIKDLQEKITTHKIFFQNNIDDIIDDEIGIMDIQMGRLFSFQIKENRKSKFFFFFGNINWKLTVQVKPTMDGRQINLSVLLKPFIESEDNMLIESITTTVTISVEGGGEDPMASRIFPKIFNSEKDKLEWEFKYNGKSASRVKVLFQNTNIKRRAQVD